MPAEEVVTGKGRSWRTSVSFPIVQKGIIRHFHPGGEHVKGDADQAAMKDRTDALLKEQ